MAKNMKKKTPKCKVCEKPVRVKKNGELSIYCEDHSYGKVMKVTFKP